MNTPLQLWMNHEYLGDNSKHKELIYSNGAIDQMMYVRDVLHPMLLGHLNYKNRESHPVVVVSEHMSKSCPLPVYQIDVPHHLHLGGSRTQLRLRGNFHDWMVSVKSDQPIDVDFGEMLDPTKTVGIPEGFKKEWAFGPLAEDPKEFTVLLYDKYQLFAFCYMLRQSQLRTWTS